RSSSHSIPPEASSSGCWVHAARRPSTREEDKLEREDGMSNRHCELRANAETLDATPDGGKEDPFRPPQARTLEDAHANEVGALVRDLGRGRVGRARSHGSKTRDGRVHPRVLARPI